MYIYKFDNKTSTFIVAAELNRTISKLVSSSWTSAWIGGTEVVITTAKTERLFAIDASSGQTDWMELDGDAKDGSVNFALPLHGTRTQYSLRVYNMTSKLSVVLCDFRFADYTSPESAVVPFAIAQPHLRLRRSSRVMYMYDTKARRKVWEVDMGDDIAHVLQPRKFGSRQALFKFAAHLSLFRDHDRVFFQSCS